MKINLSSAVESVIEAPLLGGDVILKFSFRNYLDTMANPTQHVLFAKVVRLNKHFFERLRIIAFDCLNMELIGRVMEKEMMEDNRLESTKELEQIEKGLFRELAITAGRLKHYRFVILADVIILIIGLILNVHPVTVMLISLILALNILASFVTYRSTYTDVALFYLRHGQIEAALKFCDYRRFQKRDYNLDLPIFN